MLPTGLQIACLHLSALADGDFKTSHCAVGIDRNDAAKLTKRSGRRRRMSRQSPYGLHVLWKKIARNMKIRLNPSSSFRVFRALCG